MRIQDFYDAIWDLDYQYMTHISPGLQSFIDQDDMNQLYDFYAMMIGF